MIEKGEVFDDGLQLLRRTPCVVERLSVIRVKKQTVTMRN